MGTLPLIFTDTFAASYQEIPERDVPQINEWLNKLEQHYDQPDLRNMIRIGAAGLFATGRIYAPTGVYRIAWAYDDKKNPTAIACILVASPETRRYLRRGIDLR